MESAGPTGPARKTPTATGFIEQTGDDFPCPAGTRIYAPIAGDIRHRSYGSAFGNHQFAISPDPGEPFGAGEAFFAHTRTRLADGTRVEVGDFIAEVGNEGNSSGPHLHLEYHSDTKGSWSCSVHDDPQPIIDHQEDDMAVKYDYLEKPGGTLTVGRSYVDLDQSKWDSPQVGKEDTLVYLNITPKFYEGKVAGVIRVRLQRESGDAHDPNSILIHKEGLDEDGVHTAHYLTFEKSEKGKWTKIQLKCEGGIESAKITTRYTTKANAAT